MKKGMDARIHQYANTVLALGAEPRVYIDLRRPLLESDRVAIRAVGLPAAFAIITADNPLGQHMPETHNDRAHESLAAHVQCMGIRYTPVTGCSPDRSHCEDGFAVDLSRGEARALAEEYRQDALFWFDGEDFWLDSAMLTMPPVRLPLREMA